MWFEQHVFSLVVYLYTVLIIHYKKIGNIFNGKIYYELPAHDSIVTYIKMTVRMKIITIVEIMFAESIITSENIL